MFANVREFTSMDGVVALFYAFQSLELHLRFESQSDSLERAFRWSEERAPWLQAMRAEYAPHRPSPWVVRGYFPI